MSEIKITVKGQEQIVVNTDDTLTALMKRNLQTYLAQDRRRTKTRQGIAETLEGKDEITFADLQNYSKQISRTGRFNRNDSYLYKLIQHALDNREQLEKTKETLDKKAHAQTTTVAAADGRVDTLRRVSCDYDPARARAAEDAGLAALTEKNNRVLSEATKKLRAESRAARDEIERLQRQHHSDETTKMELASQLGTAEQAKAELEARLVEVDASTENLKRELEANKAKTAELTRNQSEPSKAVAAATGQISVLTASVVEQAEQIRQLERENASLRSQFAKAEKLYTSLARVIMGMFPGEAPVIIQEAARPAGQDTQLKAGAQQSRPNRLARAAAQIGQFRARPRNENKGDNAKPASQQSSP